MILLKRINADHYETVHTGTMQECLSYLYANTTLEYTFSFDYRNDLGKLIIFAYGHETVDIYQLI